MRVAPIGMLAAQIMADLPDNRFNQQVFELGRENAAITHGHISGQLPAGALSLIIAWILRGKNVSEAVAQACNTLIEYRGHEETLNALQVAIRLAKSAPAKPQSLAELGQGWVAEEALAISLYCALSNKTFTEGVDPGGQPRWRLRLNRGNHRRYTRRLLGDRSYTRRTALPGGAAIRDTRNCRRFGHRQPMEYQRIFARVRVGLLLG